jgi:hypothetical protein
LADTWTSPITPKWWQWFSRWAIPQYFLTIDSVFKFLAVLGLLVPLRGLGLLKEWAYAGLVFLTIGASWSHLARHQNPTPGVVALALTLVSYALWKKTLEGSPKA